jgi:hypothetical protein
MDQEDTNMDRWITRSLLVALIVLAVPAMSLARGTQYMINWPHNHYGPVYVQIFDVRCYEPFERLDNFKVWVTWGQQTKCYDIGNRGSYVLKIYKYPIYNDCPMIIAGNASSFKIRYSLVPPWI